MRSSLYYLPFILSPWTVLSATQKTYETNVSRRERNLDHWDAETLAAYLGLDPDTAEPLPDTDNRYVGIDASVMFYAQWDKNSHKFAPIWDTIAKLVEAGTTESNLVMALFNCELNDQHIKLCTAGGVTHYPTLLFIGAGTYVDSDPISKFVLKDKSSGPYGATKLKRTVKFQGNLNVGDSVLDWVKTMQGLSKWHRWGHEDGGWLKTIRSLFFNPFDKKKGKKVIKNNALPIGVPTGMGGVSSATSGEGTDASKSAYVLQKELKQAETDVETMKTELEANTSANQHAGYLIESVLFPKMTNSSDGGISNEPIDVFTTLGEVNGWTVKVSNTEEKIKFSIVEDRPIILKSCVVDLSLDYCTRVSKKLTTDYLESLSSVSQEDYPSFTDMEKELREIVKEIEPFCAIFDTCFSGNFEDEECRPSTCPFTNKAACAYVASCLSDPIMEEYRDVLEKQLASRAKSGSEVDA